MFGGFALLRLGVKFLCRSRRSLEFFCWAGFYKDTAPTVLKGKAAPVSRSGFVVARHFLLLLIRFLNLRHYRPINLRAGIGHGVSMNRDALTPSAACHFPAARLWFGT